MVKDVVCAAILAAVVTAPTASAREQIRIVGSSTVYPFATAVAEQFSQTTGHRAPVIDSTGTGGGLVQFCAGVGADTPDIANASRRIKDSELQACQNNGVDEIVEIPIGYDGIVFANAKDAPDYQFTMRQVFLALAEYIPSSDDDCTLIANPHRFWSDIDPSLPNVAIEVFGPPPTSGTRDAFAEIAMEAGAASFSCLDAVRRQDVQAFQDVAHRLRRDGAWINAGENDDDIINTLERTPTAIGVAGYSFLDQNSDRIKGAAVNGVSPTFDNIATGDYVISRAMFVYAKREHAATIPGLHDYLREFVSDRAAGEFGYLTDGGLIPLSSDARADAADRAERLTTINIAAALAD